MSPDTDKIMRLKMLACDVDGVLTDGSITYGSGNIEVKAFNIKDGIAMKMAYLNDFPVVWITGRRSEAVTRRADELNVRVYQGMADKAMGLRAVAEDRGFDISQIAYLGDDLNDLPALRIAGFPCAVADSAPEVLSAADYITKARGGRGALREVVELIFHAQGRWDAGVDVYLSSLHGVRMPGH